MKLNELNNTKRVNTMPIGRNEATFKEIQYRVDSEGNVTGAFVHTKEFRPVFIPIFEEQNYQLDLLIDQLGDVETYSAEEINKHSGKKIIVWRYLREEYTNTSFNANYKEAEEDNFA